MPALALNTPSPADLWEMDRAHSLHPWTNFGPFEEKGSLVMARGEGAWLWDAEGRRYFDAIAGMWCTNIGLGRREMAQAIGDQALELAFANSFVDMTNGPSARLGGQAGSAGTRGSEPGAFHHWRLDRGRYRGADGAILSKLYGATGQNRIWWRAITAITARPIFRQSLGMRPGDRVEQFRYKEDGIHHLSVPNPYRAPGRHG